MRTLVDIPDDDIDRLDALAAQRGGSRAAEIREAVRIYLSRRCDKGWIEQGFGYWQGRDLPGPRD